MASAHRQSSNDLMAFIKQLPDNDILQAVYLLHRKLAHSMHESDINHFLSKKLQFTTVHDFAYPDKLIQQINLNHEALITVAVNFMSLTGHSGCLPESIRESILAKHVTGDTVLSDFLSLFSHRIVYYLIKLYYTFQYLCHVLHQNRHSHAITSPYYTLLLSLSGKLHDTQTPMPIRNLNLWHISAFISKQRSQESLQQLLQHYLRCRVELMPYEGRWQVLPSDKQSRLNHCRLGETSQIGKRLWLVQTNFSIIIEASSFADLTRLLPNTKAYARLRQLVADFVGNHITCSYELRLSNACILPISLSHDKRQTQRLGWTSFLSGINTQSQSTIRLNPTHSIYHVSKEYKDA